MSGCFLAIFRGCFCHFSRLGSCFCFRISNLHDICFCNLFSWGFLGHLSVFGDWAAACWQGLYSISSWYLCKINLRNFCNNGQFCLKTDPIGFVLFFLFGKNTLIGFLFIPGSRWISSQIKENKTISDLSVDAQKNSPFCQHQSKPLECFLQQHVPSLEWCGNCYLQYPQACSDTRRAQVFFLHIFLRFDVHRIVIQQEIFPQEM